MEKFADLVLLFTALALPVVLFLLFRPRSRSAAALALVVAVAVGWSFNVAYIFTTETSAVKDPSQLNGENLAIAVNYGWVCPLVFALFTWIVWHFATRRSA